MDGFAEMQQGEMVLSNDVDPRFATLMPPVF
jgi:hypothetical protein